MLDRKVPAAGFEPAAFGSGDQRSNPLSYAGVLHPLLNPTSYLGRFQSMPAFNSL